MDVAAARTRQGTGRGGARSRTARDAHPLVRRVEEVPVVTSVVLRTAGARLDVVLAGEVDAQVAGELQRVLAEAARHCGRGRGHVHVDLRRAGSDDGTAGRFLVRLEELVASRGAVLTTAPDLAGPGPAPRTGSAQLPPGQLPGEGPMLGA